MITRSTGVKTAGRALFFAVLLAGATGVQANTLSIEDQCDASAGSRYDVTRNTAFAPVALDDIKIGPALSACREAHNAGGGARMAFQLARALERAGQDLEAMKLYADAASRGHTVAMVNYGAMLGKRGDPAGEFSHYRQAAEMGDVLGAYNLSVAYRDGIGTEIDGEEAARWFDKAAAFYRLASERGSVDAMINLGLMLEAGEGTEQDLPAAARYFKQAADLGDSYGKLKLGLMQQSGTGIAKNAEIDPITHGAIEKHYAAK